MDFIILVTKSQKLVGRSLDEIASFSSFNCVWQESRGKVSLVVASLSYNGVPLNAGKNNPGRPGTQGFGGRNVVSSYHLPDELDE